MAAQQGTDRKPLNIKHILEDYAPDYDIFNEDSDVFNSLREIIYNNLDEVDRRIILMYAELGSLRKLGTELGISPSSAFLKIRDIKNKIYDRLTPDILHRYLPD